MSDFNALEEEAALLSEDDSERNNEILKEQGELREKILNLVLNVSWWAYRASHQGDHEEG